MALQNSDYMVDQFVSEVESIHSSLASFGDDLSPGKQINELFSRLVSMCCDAVDKDTMDRIVSSTQIRSILPSLRILCSRGECAMESYWANYISAGETPAEVQRRLESFPYYQNYVDLTRMELCAICAAQPQQPRRIAFIGSGPLPLTSLTILRALNSNPKSRVTSSASSVVSEEDDSDDNTIRKAERNLPNPFSVYSSPTSSTTSSPDRSPSLHTNDLHFGSSKSVQVEVLNIDCNEKAIQQSRAFCTRLPRSYSDGMRFVVDDAISMDTQLDTCDVVYMAALVGCSQEQKEDILIRIVKKMRPGAIVVVRSSNGLKTCLYPEFNIWTPDLLKILKVGAVFHPYGPVVNSAIIAEVL